MKNYRELDIISILVDILNEKKSTNPRYSLRAFARDLEISVGMLSKILDKKVPVTEKMVLKLNKYLKLSEEEITHIFSNTLLKSNHQIEKKFLSLKKDWLSSFKHWYYYPIIEMFHLKDTPVTADTVSDYLGLKKDVAQVALEQLEEIGILKKKQHEEYVLARPNNTTITIPGTNEDLIEMQKQILTKAINALTEIPYEQRSQSALTFAFKRSELPLIKEKIRKFRRQINNMSVQCKQNCDEIYTMSISLYPVTKGKNINA